MASVETAAPPPHHSEIAVAVTVSVLVHASLVGAAVLGQRRATDESNAIGPVVVELRSRAAVVETDRPERGTSGPARPSHLPRIAKPRPVSPPVQAPPGPSLAASDGPADLPVPAPATEPVGLEASPTAGRGAGPVSASVPAPPSVSTLVERQAARVLVSPRPRYPRQARLAGWEGTVVVRILIDAAGKPAAVSLSVSSGYQVLDDSAVEAAKLWRFSPALENGRPTAMAHEVRFRFRLDEVFG